MEADRTSLEQVKASVWMGGDEPKRLGDMSQYELLGVIRFLMLDAQDSYSRHMHQLSMLGGGMPASLKQTRLG